MPEPRTAVMILVAKKLVPVIVPRRETVGNNARIVSTAKIEHAPNQKEIAPGKQKIESVPITHSELIVNTMPPLLVPWETNSGQSPGNTRLLAS